MERLRDPTIPIPGESARGLLSRACGLHNIPHSWMLLKDAGATFRNRVDVSESDNIDLDVLGHILKVDPGELRARTYPLTSGKLRSFFGVELSVMSFETRVRRFSPTALRDSSYMRALWEIRDLPYCVESWDMLQVRGRCGTKQGWTRITKVERCDDCGRPLAERVEPIPVPIAFQEVLSLPALLLSPLADDQASGRAMLPEQLAHQDRSVIYEMVMSIAKVLTPRRDSTEWVRVEAIRAAANAVMQWPHGMDGVTRPEWYASGQWGRLLAKYARLGSSFDNDQDVELVGIRKAVAIGGTSREILFKAREAGLLTEHVARLAGRGDFDAFNVTELQGFSSIYSQRLSFQAAAKVMGLPLYAVEQIVATGRLPTNGMRFANEEPFISGEDYKAFTQNLVIAASKVRAHGPIDDFIGLRLASQVPGGMLKPWGEIFLALLDGQIRFALGSGDAPLMHRISIHLSDKAKLMKLSIKAAKTNAPPTSATIHKQDALEILNISGDTPVLAGLPFTQDGGRFHYELHAVLDRAEKTISLPEIAQRGGWSIARAFSEMRRKNVPLVFEGCWCREIAEKYL